MRAASRFCGVVALLVLAACDVFTGPDRPRISVELPAATFAPGAEIDVTLRNDSGSPWYYAPVCGTGVQRLDAGVWVGGYDHVGCSFVRADLGGGEMRLTYAPLLVPARGEIAVRYLLPSDAVYGEYRIRVILSERADLGGRTAVRQSPTFLVLSPSLAAP
jgi:hypothetical protein